MKKANRFFAMLLALCTILMLCAPLSAFAGDWSYIDKPGNVSGSTYASGRPKLAERLNQVFSGDIDIYYDSALTNEVSMPLGSYMEMSHTYYITAYNELCYGQTCWIYANAAYNKICGEWVGSGGYYNHTYDVLHQGDGLNYNTFKNAGVRCGAYVRTTQDGRVGHSMVVLDYNSSTITCINGNANGGGEVWINTWEWSTLQGWYGTTVQFAAQPSQSWWDSTYPKEEEYYLDLNSYLDGEYQTSLGNYGTCDVYINGTLKSSGCTDYYVQYPKGTKYEIKNIKATSGHRYIDNPSGNISGTINGTTSVVLRFATLYSVTFKNWDETVLDTQTVTHGSSATEPSHAIREGYTFTGWDKDFSNVTSDLTVTAQYSINTYTVTFSDWDGNTLKTQTVEHGKTATAPENPSRDGYTFIGWDKDFSNVMSDLTVTAQYKKIANALGDANGDGTVNTLDAVMILRLIAEWDVNPDMVAADVNGDGSVNTLDAVNILRYIAGWDIEYFKTFTITFDANGGTVSVYSQEYNCNTELYELPSASRDYFKFLGWFTEKEGGEKITVQTVFTSPNSITVYAHWEQNPISDWVRADEVPDGAEIVNRKWTYTRTEKTEATSVLSGWASVGTYWKQTGNGTQYYAGGMSGFPTDNALYKKYNNTPWSSYSNDTNKRDVSTTHYSYIYYHWARTSGVDGGPYNRLVNGSYTSEYRYFTAFEDSKDYGHVDSSGVNGGSDYYYVNRGLASDDSYWWLRTEIRKQVYTDYQKMYQLEKVTECESDTQVTAGGEISDVVEWVQYRAR